MYLLNDILALKFIFEQARMQKVNIRIIFHSKRLE